MSRARRNPSSLLHKKGQNITRCNHQRVSFLKTFVRIVVYVLLLHISIPATLVLVASELVGIVEEIGQ